MTPDVPDSLVAYGHALEDAIGRDLRAGRSRRRRRLVLRGAVVAAVLTAVALGALSLVSRPASGTSVVHRAAAAIARSPGTILHVDMLGSQDNGDGTSITWRDESWQQESAPYHRRQVETSPDGTVTESATVNRSEEVYDPKTDTVYVSPPASASSAAKPNRPDWQIEPGSKAGTYVLRLRGGRIVKAGTGIVNVRSLPLTADQVKALRSGDDVVAFTISKKDGVLTTGVTVMRRPAGAAKPSAKAVQAPDPDPTSGDFRAQILALLGSGGAHVVGHETVDGHDAIEIVSADGHTTYDVDPHTYAPVELRTRGTTGGTTLRFRTYENLALAGNEGLLSLEAQHPAARIDRSAADYQAAEARLFPHG